MTFNGSLGVLGMVWFGMMCFSSDFGGLRYSNKTTVPGLHI